MDVLDFEPDQPIASTQQVKASTLLQKAGTARSLDLRDANLNALFQPADAPSEAGLPANHVLEISSPPGVGKTRWSMMFAVQAAMQSDQEEGNEILFVDTEGHASPANLHQFALACTENDAERAMSICRRIHYMRVSRQDEFLALLNSLQSWLEAHPAVRMVVIDCLSSPLRLSQFPVLLPAQQASDSQNQMRNNALSLLRRTLATLCAQQDGYTFIVTTQMATKFNNDMNAPAGQREAVLEPQLGTTWQPPNLSFRLALYCNSSGQRYAHLVGAPLKTKSQNVGFAINAKGMLETSSST